MTILRFEIDLLQELRERTRMFLQLALAYLAAAGAAVTAFKLGKADLISIGAKFSGVAWTLVLVLTLDVILEVLVFNDWLSARTGSRRRVPASFLRWFLRLQPFYHLIFVTGLVSSAMGYAQGYTDTHTRIEGRVLLQERVEAFLSERGRPPASIAELNTVDPRMPEVLEKLEGEDVVIEAAGPKGYQITFSGWDKTFGTADDEIATQEFLLRRAFQRLSEKSQSPANAP